MRRALLVLLVLLSLVAAACGGGEAAPPQEGSFAATEFPVTVGGVVIPSAPQRIVSASATHTEILYAIGAGDRLVATDTFSNYPPQAGSTDKIDAFNLGVEAVAELDPDLVILTFDPGEVAAGLVALGIPVLLFSPPEDLEGAYGQMLAVGRATGLSGEAAALVADMRSRVQSVVAGIPAADDQMTYYYELDPSLVSITSSTFVGSLLSMLNLRSVADAADTGEAAGYPQLSAEYLLMEDPDFIFLADTLCCSQSASQLAARPGWGALGAVTGGKVVELNDDVASRWGPRLVDLLTVVAAAVYGGGATG